jgi:hypothetical protein
MVISLKVTGAVKSFSANVWKDVISCVKIAKQPCYITPHGSSDALTVGADVTA